MSWKLELGPVPRGLNVKARSWLETMMTIEPFALRVSVQRRPLSSVQGLAGHDGPETYLDDVNQAIRCEVKKTSPYR